MEMTSLNVGIQIFSSIYVREVVMRSFIYALKIAGLMLLWVNTRRSGSRWNWGEESETVHEKEQIVKVLFGHL